MTPEIRRWAEWVKPLIEPEIGHVLEVGSMNVNGSVRGVFEPDAYSYIGADISKGKGVDVIADVMELHKYFGYESFDLVICCETLEHTKHFWVALEQMNRTLKTGGHLIITTPTFGFPLHRYPKDYWRFGEDAYREVLFKGYEILSLEQVIDFQKSPGICCLGRKL